MEVDDTSYKQTCSDTVETIDFIEEVEVEDTCSVKVDNPSYRQTCTDTVETIVGTEGKYYFK